MLDLVVSPPHPTRGAVRWQPTSDFRCSLQSEDSEVLDYARLVFVSQIQSIEEHDETPDLCWLIERPEAGEMWRAHCQSPETPALESTTLGGLLAHIEYGTLQALLSRGTDSFFSLHAALLSKGNRSVIVVGPKEAGKSTLACALWAGRGWHLRCDDAVLINKQNQARPAPRRVSLRHSSRALLGEALWARLAALPATISTENGLLFHPHELEPLSDNALVAPQPAVIFFLARRGSNAPNAATVAIAPALAALALLPYSTFLLPRGEEFLCPERVDWGQSLPRLTQFTASVPAYDLGRGPLDEMTREVERLAFHANPVSAS